MTLDSLRALREAATYPTRPAGRATEKWRADARAADLANDQLARLAPCLVGALIEAHEALSEIVGPHDGWMGPDDMQDIARAAVARIDTLEDRQSV